MRRPVSLPLLTEQIVPTWQEIEAQCDDEALRGKLICHCSGALPSTELAGCSAARRLRLFDSSPLCHPLENRQHRRAFKSVFRHFEGNEEGSTNAVSNRGGYGQTRYQVIETAQKARYHAAAALASNHVVALYRLACDELAKCGFTPEGAERAMAPLFLGKRHAHCRKRNGCSAYRPR